jgi:copper chaperone
MQTEVLKVTGMTCGGCTSKVAHALKAIPGVADVKVSLPAGEATVQYDERLTTPNQLRIALRGAGYSLDARDAARDHQSKSGCC